MPLGAIQKLHGRKYSGKDAINIEITGVIGAAMRKCRGSYGGVSGQLWCKNKMSCLQHSTDSWKIDDHFAQGAVSRS